MDISPTLAAGGSAGGFNPTTLLMLAVVAVLFIFMFRRQRKQQRESQNMQSKLAPGAEVMTTTGIFGTVVSIDEDENQVIIESTPGTELRVHRQAIGKVLTPAATAGVDPAEGADDIAPDTGADPDHTVDTGKN